MHAAVCKGILMRDTIQSVYEIPDVLAQFMDTRNRTREIVKNLEPDDFTVQTAFYSSPPKWHIGHVSWLYEIILDKTSNNYRFYSDEFKHYLNSYYNQFGVPHDKASRGAVSRPTLDQIFQYFDTMTGRIADAIRSCAGDENARLALIIMGINHECQHQELLIYDIQRLLASLYRPVQKNSQVRSGPVTNAAIPIPGGIYTMGYGSDGFCYDVELPQHKVYLNDYKIAKYPVSNREYLEFVQDGGYDNFKYWLSDGWDKVRSNGWQAPMYWKKIDDTWHTDDFAGVRAINPNEPVVHVSFYEADAFCRWAGKRLPTEAEWEKAACHNPDTGLKTVFPWGDELASPDKCNVLESYQWQCSELGGYPGGKSGYGCHQMIGDVWEWTASEFVGYPGFRTGFAEYNDKWFTGQKVLRGGSFGTPAASIRASYRNFFRMDERWMFAGFRYAED